MKLYGSMIIVLTFGLLLKVEPPGRGGTNRDNATLPGTWKLVVAENDGERKDEEELRKVRVLISPGTIVIDDASRERETKEEMSFKLDPSKTPKEIDFSDKTGKPTNKGIYALEGDQLKLCYGEPGKDRPKTFATKPGSGLFLLVLTRAKH